MQPLTPSRSRPEGRRLYRRHRRRQPSCPTFAAADFHRRGEAAHPGRGPIAPAILGGVGATCVARAFYSLDLEQLAGGFCDAGAFGALVPLKRGLKVAAPNPLAAELAAVQRENNRLTRRLARAEAIIDVQKNDP